MPHTNTARSEKAIRNDAHRATLADDADRPICRLDFREHGGKTQDGAAAEVGQPLRVGANDPHPFGARTRRHGLLARLALSTELAKA